MKINFYLDVLDDLKLPKAKSDLVVEDCDLIDLLLSGDLSNENSVKEFEQTVFSSGETWWFNAAKVIPENNTVLLQAAFDVSAEARIKTSSLKSLIEKWKLFLVDKKPKEITISED